jgi:hypothetical protein
MIVSASSNDRARPGYLSPDCMPMPTTAVPLRSDRTALAAATEAAAPLDPSGPLSRAGPGGFRWSASTRVGNLSTISRLRLRAIVNRQTGLRSGETRRSGYRPASPVGCATVSRPASPRSSLMLQRDCLDIPPSRVHPTIGWTVPP